MLSDPVRLLRDSTALSEDSSASLESDGIVYKRSAHPTGAVVGSEKDSPF